MTGKDYMGLVAQLPCVVCGARPAQVHHIREGQGMGQRADDFLVVAACELHHTGPLGIHGLGRRAFERMHKTTELALLAATIKGVAERLAR